MTGSLPVSGNAPMIAPLKFADGSAAAPSLTFNSDPSIGFFKNGDFIGATKPITGVLPIGLGPLPWSRVTVPAGWVLCYGQTLSRTAYADLWVVAQAEIAAGNPMYNNGNGSTTFGILDMRGRVAAGYDVMGGAAANRLPGAFGLGFGVNQYALSEGQLPSLTKALAGVTDPIQVFSTGANFMLVNNGILNITGGFGPGGSSTIAVNGQSAIVTSYGAFTPQGTVSLGGGGVHSIVQPTIPMNAILYAGA